MKTNPQPWSDRPAASTALCITYAVALVVVFLSTTIWGAP